MACEGFGRPSKARKEPLLRPRKSPARTSRPGEKIETEKKLVLLPKGAAA